ncbi:hypothetical protein CVT25_001098, partial [Psilocybe cyanescens]
FNHDINAPIQKYIAGITELAGKLKAIGVELTDEDIMDVLIFNLDTEYSNIAASLMTKDKLTITDVTSTLIEEEQRKGGAPQSTDTATTLYIITEMERVRRAAEVQIRITEKDSQTAENVTDATEMDTL